MNYLVHRALCNAVRTLDVPATDERRLLGVLEAAHQAVSEGRVAEGVVILGRFPALLEHVTRSNRRPARSSDAPSPFDRLSRARRPIPNPVTDPT